MTTHGFICILSRIAKALFLSSIWIKKSRPMKVQPAIAAIMMDQSLKAKQKEYSNFYHKIKPRESKFLRGSFAATILAVWKFLSNYPE